MTQPSIAVLICILLCTTAGDAQAREWRHWCGESLGWHFYCDPDQERAPPSADPSPPPAQDSAMDRIQEMRRTLEESRAAAILDPSPEKVAAYLHCSNRHCSGPPPSRIPSGARCGPAPISITP